MLLILYPISHSSKVRNLLAGHKAVSNTRYASKLPLQLNVGMGKVLASRMRVGVVSAWSWSSPKETASPLTERRVALGCEHGDFFRVVSWEELSAGFSQNGAAIPELGFIPWTLT